MWSLSFISKEELQKHILETISGYTHKLTPFTLAKFNQNIVDPIKLVFDQAIYNCSWEQVIQNEIFRQRDKSSNNDIGYFHQGLFRYFPDCRVPTSGWDVILERESRYVIDSSGYAVRRIYVELKNKHNTMNSSSSAKTYMRMQAQLLADDDSACFLVEVIAKKSQNIPWVVSIDGHSQKHRMIRRVSIDEFYALITGQKDAFYQLCLHLPSLIQETLVANPSPLLPQDSVLDEIHEIAKSKNISFVLALYLLGFSGYLGFPS